MSYHETVFIAGRTAAIQGKPLQDNPYTKGDDTPRMARLAELWCDGWFNGKHGA